MLTLVASWIRQGTLWEEREPQLNDDGDAHEAVRPHNILHLTGRYLTFGDGSQVDIDVLKFAKQACEDAAVEVS